MACLACRASRKECVPDTPRCARCKRMGIEECVYIGVKKRGVGKTLRNGGACVRCRRRKKRCDGKRPCSTCINSESVRECTGDGTVQPWPESISPSHSSSDPPPERADPTKISIPPSPIPQEYTQVSGAAENDLDVTSRLGSLCRLDRLGVRFADEEQEPILIGDISAVERSKSEMQLVFSTMNTGLSRVSSEESCSPESYVPNESGPPVSQERSNSETQLVSPLGESSQPHQLLPIAASTLSFLLSLRLLYIARQLHTSLSFADPVHLQVSDITSPELDLSFRLAALQRLRRFGIYLTGPKQDAVMRGDASGTIVHPFFIAGAAALGANFCAGDGDSLAVVRLHAKYSQLALEQIAEINKGCSATLKVHVFLFITAATLGGRWLDFTRRYLKTACIALNAAKLQFVPATGRPLGLAEDVHEGLTVLSQIIYLENYLFLAVDGSEPKMTTRIEREFRHELPETYPQLFEICPLTMRTQGILLVKDATSLITLCSADGTKSGQWKYVYDEVVVRLDEYSDTLLRNIRRFTEIGDIQGTEIIQSSCISCLAHLALLCDYIGRLEPNSKPRMDAVCDSSLERLVRLTQEMGFDEYTYFDLLLKNSWETSFAVFDSRIGSLPQGESTSLRSGRKIVVEAWSDIRARLPEPTPPIHSALMMFVDGREQGSKYPNFMLASERWAYGL